MKFERMVVQEFVGVMGRFTSVLGQEAELPSNTALLTSGEKRHIVSLCDMA
jgi:hypothetical protein